MIRPNSKQDLMCFEQMMSKHTSSLLMCVNFNDYLLPMAMFNPHGRSDILPLPLVDSLMELGQSHQPLRLKFSQGIENTS